MARHDACSVFVRNISLRVCTPAITSFAKNEEPEDTELIKQLSSQCLESLKNKLAVPRFS